MYLEDTTTVRNWLWTACSTNLVSASSCVDFMSPKSVAPVDDLASSSSLKVPANKIPQTRNVLDLLCYQPMRENWTSYLVEVNNDLTQAV